MKTSLVAAASAIFFAAMIVELSTRVWPGNHLALLLVAAFGLFVNGLFNSRLAAPRAAAAPTDSRFQEKQAQPRRQADSRSRPSRSRQSESPSRPADRPHEDGTVKWFNRNKGFGFIIRESGEEIFVHQRSIRLIGEGGDRHRPALRDGQAVSFQVAERDKGAQAEDVVARD